MKQIIKLTQTKKRSKPNAFVSVNSTWCSIKNDYRTLVGLEDVNVVETYTDIDEEEDDE